MPDSATLCHTKWDCKYRVVFIPKYRRKALYHALRRYLGEVFRALASEPQVAQRPAERAQFSAIVTGTGGLWRQPHGQRYVFLHHVRDEVGGAVCEYAILRGTDALKVADLPPDSVTLSRDITCSWGARLQAAIAQPSRVPRHTWHSPHTAMPLRLLL